MNVNLKTKQIILFDGVCNFCSGIVTFLIKRDKKAQFKFSPLQSDTGILLLSSYNITTKKEKLETFVYIRHNKVYIKSTAALFVLKDIGGWYRSLFIFIIIPAFVRNFFYSIISKSRYRIWGKKDKCMLPTPEIIDRFMQKKPAYNMQTPYV